MDLKPESPPGSEFRAGALTFAYLFDTLVMGQGGQGGQGGHRLENTTRGRNVAMSQGSLLLILRGGSLPLKYSNFQQFDKKLSQFDKKLRTGLIRLKVTSNPTLPKGQKPKLHLTTTCQTDKKW